MDKHLTPTPAHESDWLEDIEGQLALDVYQTDDVVILKAPIAGVKPADLDVSVTDEVVTIKGARRDEAATSRDGYFIQECYWGDFVRTYVLPVAVDADRAEARLQDGLLTITIPKLEKSKTRTIQIQAITS